MADPELDPDSVQKYADRTPFAVSETRATDWAAQFTAFDDVVSDLEALAESSPADDRAFRRPTAASDPSGAFLATCSVRGRPEGPLSDMTVAVKDNVAVRGLPMTCGSPVLADHRPARDATVVKRLLNAGAEIVGKANMHEFAFGGDPSRLRFRRVRNPVDPEREPGGSSAGSAVAVRNGDVALAVGSDTGGSVRCPASWCGVVGIKPTRGLVSHNGFVNFARTLDTVGTLARSVETAARGLAAMAGADGQDVYTGGVEAGDYGAAALKARDGLPEPTTLGLPEELFGRSPEVEATVRTALETLADTSAVRLESVSIEAYEYALPAWFIIAMTEMGMYLRANLSTYWAGGTDTDRSLAFRDALGGGGGDGRSDWGSTDEGTATDSATNGATNTTGGGEMSPPDWFREHAGKSLGAHVQSGWLYAEHLADAHGNRPYALAERARSRVIDSVEDCLSSVDVLAAPTVPIVAPERGADRELLTTVANTALFNLTGHPAVSIPCGTHENLPVGLEFVGQRFGEASLMQTAARAAQVVPDR